MAVEENRRKRKHQNINDALEIVDEGASVVPKKVAKKTQKSPTKKGKQQQETPSREVANGEITAEEEIVKLKNPHQKLKKRKNHKEEYENEESNEAAEEFKTPAAEAAIAEEEEEGVEDERMEDEYHDSGFEPDEKELKFSKDFKMLNFRTKLRGTNFIADLRHFLHLAQTTRPRIVAKYIEKRGKPLELAEALERVDKTNTLQIAYLCQALQLVVMEILSNQINHKESAVHACRYFLKSHGATLELLLMSTQLNHRRIALKLLAAIVCVEPQLGRQVLSSYDILTNVKTIENFLSHSKFELHEEETVRKCFIHFVLSYLIDGNILLIRNILDRGTLILALVSGLLYDDSATVCVVLEILRKYVLECAEISKTKKIAVFDLECCKHFARLYDWNGPKVYAAKCKQSKSGGGQVNLQPQQIEAIVDPLERDAVAAAVHEFLEVLLTSRKHGITFDAISNFRQKHNAIQGKLIGFLYKPWCNDRKTELVLKILNACPDLARHTVRNFAGIVNPMRTQHRDWVQAVNFLTTIINTLHPKLLRTAFDKITLTDFSYWIKDICLPIETLVLLTGSKMLRHKNFQFRLATNRLLLAMFTQYSNYMAAITKREQQKSGVNSLRRMKFDILNHILVNFPTVEDILFSLHVSVEKQDEEPVMVLAHLEVALDLVLIICKENRSFVNKTNTILDYLEILRPLYASDGPATTAVEPATAATQQLQHDNIKVELKAIKTILLLFPKALEPTEKLFSSVVKSFMKAFVFGGGAAVVQREAGELMRGIFKNTGLFDASELEIDLWLEALRFFDANTVDVVTAVFIEVLQVTKAEVDMPKTAETVTNQKNLRKLFENIENGLSVQAYIETLSISKLLPLIFKGVEIVKPLDKYLETVCLLMYHYYPTPEHVLRLYEMEFKSLSNYMNSWLSLSTEGTAEEDLQLKGKIAERVPQLCELQAAILDAAVECKFEDMFAEQTQTQDSDVNFEVELNGKLVKLNSILQNERTIMLYVEEIMFVVAQLVEKQTLQRVQAERAANYLINCLRIVKAIDAARKCDTIDFVDADNASFLAQMLKYIFSVRIGYIRSTELFSAADESHLNYLWFLRELTENCNQIDAEHFEIYSANYRLKIVKAVAISLHALEETKAQSDQLVESVKLLQAFNMNGENCLEILNLLATTLKYNDFFMASPSASTSDKKSIYYEMLVYVLQRLSTLGKSVKCDMFINKFVKIYINFIRKLEASDLNLEQLEEAFYNFLLISHQYIPQLGAKFFDCMFVERKLSKSTIKLATLQLERDDKLQGAFINHLRDNLNKKELIYPLLKVAFEKNICIDSTLLQSIYQAYKNGFMKTIEKPQKAGVIYKEHVECSIALIEHCMPKSECVDFCNKNFKFDVIELYQMRIIHAIYKKAFDTIEAEASKQKSTIFVNFINLQIQMLSIDLKKHVLDKEKLDLFAFFLYEWWQLGPKNALANEEENFIGFDADFTKILKSQQWLNFCKTCLKIGMHINEAETELQAADDLNGLLLKLLAYLCSNLYADAESIDEQHAEPAQLFEMICTHSKFNDILLNQRATAVKTAVLHLLHTLARKSPSALSILEIPIILGAYQAKLGVADRYALALLQLFETHDGPALQQYRPFIWGESAVAFYALRSADEERAKLQQQETSIAQVMSLIDKQICEYTIDNFPIWRKLNVAQQLPPLQFENPQLQSFAFGANALERRIEMGHTQFEEADLRLCPKRETIYEQCYDPAFFIPLMNMCFAPEAYVHPARPVQNGLLALVFAALSAQDKDMRLAAGCAQLRYRTHFEHNKFFERPLWIQAYDNIQVGLSDLRAAWMKHKKNSGTPRVPYISGLFVAKAFNLTTDPTHLLYKQLTMYLRLKSSFNFQCIPEFNVLFYSPEIEHHSFRQFILEVIRNGIKSSSDLFLLVTTNTFKVLMGFYGSTMSTLDMNLLILSVFSTCVKIPASTKIMIENVGILPWLSSILSTIEFYHFDIIEGLISIINNLWYALKANAAEFHNFAYISMELHHLVLALLPHLSARISAANFAKVLNILNKTTTTATTSSSSLQSQYLPMSSTQLNHLIDCAQKHFPQQYVRCIESIKELGGTGAATQHEYCQQLYQLSHSQQLNSTAILALSSLRSYVIAWWQCHHGNTETSSSDVLNTSAD